MGWKLPTLTAVLWVIALTVISVAVGALIAGPDGGLIGAIPLALGAVLAGYVPGIREAILRRQDEQAQLEQEIEAAQERWDAVGEPTTEANDCGPAALLRPDRAIVQFTGRETELGVLRAWCASEEACSVRAIVGAGGVGKTRLTLTVASEWESRGGEWRRVDSGQEAQAVAAARGVTSGPLLLVVDYAETRTDLEKMLRAVLADPGPIRVLLVARSLGEWWDRLIEESAFAIARLLTAEEPIRLGEQITRESSDAELIAEAIPQFARALECAAPERPEFELSSSGVPVLVLHTAALIAVLRFRQDPSATLHVVVAEGVLDELLEHEARYWRRKAVAAGLPDDGALLKPVVALAALLRPGNLAEAAEIVARVPDLSDISSAQRRSWGRWLYELYPADFQSRLGSLQPDLVAELHVVNQLVTIPGLAQACLTDLSDEQAEQALTVLARAWAHQEAARQLIADALHADLTHLAVPAAQVAIQTRSALGTLLADALREATAPQEVLIRVAETLPYPSVALAQAHHAITWRVLQSLSGDADPALVAEWSDRAGLTLAQLGRSSDALSVTEDAVAIYRELATTIPDRYRPDLAASLNTLGVRLSELGRVSQATSVTEEAVGIYRELVAIDSDRYRPDLAAALSNLGVRLWAQGRAAEALPIADEAITVFRELAGTDPDHYRSYLARSLTNLGIWHSELGKPAEALPLIENGTLIYRELAEANPDRYRPDFAQMLANRAGILSRLERPAEALLTSEEAVAIYRDLAEASPDRYRPSLAGSLTNLASNLSDVGRPADALPIVEETVTFYRELAEANPALYRFYLAGSLSNQGLRLMELERSSEALPFADEAVALFRNLAAANPDRYRPDLAQSIYNLTAILSALGEHSKAQYLRDEADTLRTNP